MSVEPPKQAEKSGITRRMQRTTNAVHTQVGAKTQMGSCTTDEQIEKRIFSRRRENIIYKGLDLQQCPTYLQYPDPVCSNYLVVHVVPRRRGRGCTLQPLQPPKRSLLQKQDCAGGVHNCMVVLHAHTSAVIAPFIVHSARQ